MRKFFLLVALYLLTYAAVAQQGIDELLETEYQAGHFNGAALVMHGGKVVSRVNKGFANLQFMVPITGSTRFPIASLTKTFTAI